MKRAYASDTTEKDNSAMETLERPPANTKRCYTIEVTETNEEGFITAEYNKRFVVEPIGDDLTETDAKAMEGVPSKDNVVRMNGILVDKNAMTSIPGHVSSYTVLPRMEKRLQLKTRRESPPIMMKEAMKYITPLDDHYECTIMLEEPEGYASDMGLIALSRLPPWKTRKGHCSCPVKLKKKHLPAACQFCLKRLFLALWMETNATTFNA